MRPDDITVTVEQSGRIIVSDDDPDVEVLVDLMTNASGYDDGDAS